MEARAEYLGRVERPRLTVVKDDGGTAGYSALPHIVMRDTSLSRDARLLYAILQSYWWQGGECFASHATLAADMGCTDRHLRRFLRELVAAGKITERRRGQGQAKAYAPVDSASQQDRSVRFNRTDPSASETNRTDLSAQQDRSVRFNRTDLSHPKKKTPEDSSGRKKPRGGGAADAADPPADGETAKKSSKGTRCPDTFPLETKHYAYAAEHGYVDIARVAAITDAFLSHHRFKGTIGKDWYAGWQNWIRKQREIDDDRASKQPVAPRNGRSDMPPPGAASKQGSKWADAQGFRYHRAGGAPDDR